MTTILQAKRLHFVRWRPYSKWLVFAFAAAVVSFSPAAAAKNPYQNVNIIGVRTIQLPNFKKFPKWVRVMPELDMAKIRNTPDLAPWTAWAESLRSLPVSERLGAINTRVNQKIVYRTDQQMWGKKDYWETPSEVAAKKLADCEGYVIFKNYLGLVAGIPAENMFLLVGTIKSTREVHALLIADVDGPASRSGAIYILDNRIQQMIDIQRARDLTAIYSVDLAKALMYLRR